MAVQLPKSNSFVIVSTLRKGVERMVDAGAGLLEQLDKRGVTIGNLAVVAGLLGAIGSFIFEASAIRTTLADSIAHDREAFTAAIASEREIRVASSANLASRMDDLGRDVRELRTALFRPPLERHAAQ